MEAQDPLSQLADIRLPEDVSWWPPALGWWLLACLCLIVVGVMARHLLRRWQRQRQLKVALNELEHSWQAYQESLALRPEHRDAAALQVLQDIHILLRRVALHSFPPQRFAHLSGREWLLFLDATSPRSGFAALADSGVADSQYRRHWQGDPQPFYTLAREWVRHRYLHPDDRSHVTAGEGGSA